MFKFKGKGVYGAIGFGRVSVFDRNALSVVRADIENADDELERLQTALIKADSQLKKLYEKALSETDEESAQIFDIHRMMLEDEDYLDFIRSAIREQGVNAEYAVSLASDSFSEMFSEMEDEYMRARSADVKDISDRLIRALTGAEENTYSMKGTGGVILCADDLSPSEAISLDKSRICGIVTALGSASGHAAIIARSMGIPAIIGVGQELLDCVNDGDEAAADGFNGEVFIFPDDKTKAALLEKQRTFGEHLERLKQLIGKDNATADGRRIDIYANIGSPDDVDEVLKNDAGGIGLFRSEFLFMDRPPSEEEQFSAYKKVLEHMNGKEVIIRTADIGADKQTAWLRLAHEENPALGLRGIRLTLTRPEIFKTQLRALYRASVYGKLGIMFPMIANVWELEKALEICSEVKRGLDADGLPYSDSVKVGIMIETPAAALLSDRLAPLADFFSVGTNDLIQYTLACDRTNSALEQFRTADLEAVMRLIEYSAQSAHRFGKPIGICGELAADTSLTERFIKMGIDELSVSPRLVLQIRDRVRKINSI